MCSRPWLRCPAAISPECPVLAPPALVYLLTHRLPSGQGKYSARDIRNGGYGRLRSVACETSRLGAACGKPLLLRGLHCTLRRDDSLGRGASPKATECRTLALGEGK